MEHIARRLGISLRMDIDKVGHLEELAHIDKMRPTKKAEMIIIEYLASHPINEQPSGE